MSVETKQLNCINCPMGCLLTVTLEDGKVTNVTGNTCPRGETYAHQELTDPQRMLTSTVSIEGGELPLLPVVSKTTLPKGKILDCALALRDVHVKAPVKTGDVIVKDILGLGSNMRSRPICYCRMWRTRLTDRRKTTFSLCFFRQRKCRRCSRRSVEQGWNCLYLSPHFTAFAEARCWD